MLQKTLQSFMKSDPDKDLSNFDGDLTGGFWKPDQTGGFWKPDQTGGFWKPDQTGGFFKENVREDYMDCREPSEGIMNCREGGMDCIKSAAVLAKQQGGR